jgi:hypothetical protein
MTISNTIRAAIQAATSTRRELSRISGVPESGISRFMAGAEIRSNNLDALAEALGIEARPAKPTSTRTATSRTTKGGK